VQTGIALDGIVVIEDNDIMRDLMMEWLSDEGYQVRTPDQASSWHDGTPELVIADVYMPRDFGIARLRSIRSRFPDVPVIAISGQFFPGVVGEGDTARALGVKRVIAKPFGRAQLLTAVCAVTGVPR
jgi:CheY-like chemotaxis protein